MGSRGKSTQITDKETSIKLKLFNKIQHYESTLPIAVSDFIRNNKRTDRDRVIQLQSKIMVCKELMQEL